MGCTQKRAYVEPRDVLQINGGLHVLREHISSVVPRDFGWGLLIDASDVVISWHVMREGGVSYDNEIRTHTVLDALVQLRRIDWGSERLSARVFGSDRAFAP